MNWLTNIFKTSKDTENLRVLLSELKKDKLDLQDDIEEYKNEITSYKHKITEQQNQIDKLKDQLHQIEILIIKQRTTVNANNQKTDKQHKTEVEEVYNTQPVARKKLSYVQKTAWGFYERIKPVSKEQYLSLFNNEIVTRKLPINNSKPIKDTYLNVIVNKSKNKGYLFVWEEEQIKPFKDKQTVIEV